jgi:malate dehydrogenase (oxaloacetate-decarboxylating)(NADP+)
MWESTAVARAAMASGVALKKLDLEEYREALESRLGRAREAMRSITHRARHNPLSIVYPEGTHPKILRAAAQVVEEGIAHPILLGTVEAVHAAAKELDIPLGGLSVLDPARSPNRGLYAEELFILRRRKGVTREDAASLVLTPNVFGAMMVRNGDAEGLVSGVTQHYPDTIRPMLQIIGPRPDVPRVVGVFLLTFRNRSFFLADATVNVEPDADSLAEIALLAAEVARRFNVEPRVAMLSFSNFGSVDHPLVRLVQDATAKLHRRSPGLIVDGEMQADTAVWPDLTATHFPFSAIQGDANVLVFPDLTSGNIAYKLLKHLGGAEVIGPILVGMARPVHVLHQSSEIPDIVHLTALAVADAQEMREEAGRARPSTQRKAG